MHVQLNISIISAVHFSEHLLSMTEYTVAVPVVSCPKCPEWCALIPGLSASIAISNSPFCKRVAACPAVAISAEVEKRMLELQRIDSHDLFANAHPRCVVAQQSTQCTSSSPCFDIVMRVANKIRVLRAMKNANSIYHKKSRANNIDKCSV